MFNLFSLFSSHTPRKKKRTSVSPDLAFLLVVKYAKSIDDFNDDTELHSRVERFANELDDIAHVQERMTYDDALAQLRKLDDFSATWSFP